MSAMPTVTILSNGKTIPGEFQILSVETVKTANKLPWARIVIIDGSGADQDFAISGSNWFEPGKEIEIKLRYEGKSKDTTVFKGVVTSQNIKADTRSSRLVVELKDSCLKLDAGRQNALYNQKSTPQVIKAVLERNKVKAGKIEGSNTAAEQLVQYQSSDWDFLLMRADVSQLVVLIDDGVFSAVTPSISGKVDYNFKYGITPCFGFEMNAGIAERYENISATDWDIKKQEISSPARASEFKLDQGKKLSPGQIAKEINRTDENLSSMISQGTPEMQPWTDSVMQRDRLSLFRGAITVEGDPKIKLGGLIEISGAGDLFNGKTLITGVRHSVNKEGWQSVIQFGLSPKSYFEQYPHINALPAAGLLPGISGLQIGVVQKFKADPSREFRLQVKIPAFNNKQDSIVWARLSTTYAGKEKGLFFVPDPGDEVIVGFINDDPREAIILGGAYSEKNKPPKGFAFDEKNDHQGIITKSNLQLAFDDEKQIITISSPESDSSKNEITLEGKKGINLLDKYKNNIVMNDKGITLKDKNGNSIVMSSSGISLESKGDLKLKGTKGEFNVSGKMKLKASMIDLN